MELDKLSKLEEEPPLSGAYMRGLVKQIATSRVKDLMNPNDQKHGKVVDSQQSTQPQQHKKQVRRRLHTSKPYQERLLNMAEARKEIVTALKFHRAAMKEASEQQQQQQQQWQSISPQPSQHPSFEQDGKFKSRRNRRIYPSCTTNSSNDFSCSYLPFPPPFVPNSYTWPAASPIAPPPLILENPDFVLPNQTLGLNLNFHDFNNLDATVHLNNSSSSSSSSYSSGTSYSPTQDVPSVGTSQVEKGFSLLVDTSESNAAATQVAGGLHKAMDDEAMKEIRLLGDQYQMEWNDNMNSVKSACWSKFLKNMEHGVPDSKAEIDAYHNFEQQMEFPAWLSADEGFLEQCSEDYFQDSTLPCMDIGDIDGMDDDWLA